MLDELEVAVENATARHRQRRHGVPIRVVELIVLKYLFRRRKFRQSRVSSFLRMCNKTYIFIYCLSCLAKLHELKHSGTNQGAGQG